MPSAVERFDTVTAVLAGVVTGAAVGVVGSVFHRFASGEFPTGVVAALAAVALGAVFIRALAGRGAYAAFAVTLLGVIALAWLSPDRIVVGQPVGLAWSMGAVILGVTGFLLPESWFE
ncbi:MAG: hypothetical protein ACQERF_06740 [Actinomycetota bacterium]